MVMTSLLLAAVSFFCIVRAYFLLLAAIKADEGSAIHHPPPQVTWLLWFAVDLALIIGAEGFSKVPMLAYALGSLRIAHYAVKHGRKGWDRESLQVLSLGAAALVAWCVTEGAVASVFLVAAASVGAIELCKDLWRELRTPGFTAWVYFWVGGLTGLVAASWTPSNVIVLGGFFVIQSLVLLLGSRFFMSLTVVVCIVFYT